MDRWDGLFADLSAAFDAQLERQESDAASDLALSLSHDADLHEALSDGEPVVAVIEGASHRVTRVARDYVVAQPGDLAIRFEEAIFLRPGSGAAPEISESSLAQLLHARVRRGAWVRCCTRGLEHEGRLTQVGRDHLVVGMGPRRRVIPLGSVRWIRLAHEDSAGVS